MSFNISRQTLYAILSAIENDLRNLIITQLGSQLDTKTLLGEALWSRAIDKMKRDMGSSETQEQLTLMITYIDFDDLRQVLGRYKNSLPADLAKYIRERDMIFSGLIPIRNRIAHTRPLHPSDLSETIETAAKLVSENESVWLNLRHTMECLKTEPSFVNGLQIPVDDNDSSKHNLPIPDFDETGFVGRDKWVAEITRKCLKGAYPVITIMADGGIGKTALALKVAYDILDLPDCPYEAIVWATSKTLQLTKHEITKIRGAISDSLGMFQHVAKQFAVEGAAIDNPLQEVLDIMQVFKILLILDNLETILDDNVRDFLGQLPAGSKVLITSRVGIGAYEDRVSLKPMETSEASQLLRALASVRGVSSLTSMSTISLEGYCRRMQNNPGWIKWFVSAVQAGERPEDILANPALFLEFCMQNVYRYMSEDSRTLLATLYCLPGKHSQAELAYLSEMETITFQRAVQQLGTTSFMSLTYVPRGDTYETTYELAELVRTYMRKHHASPSSEQKKYQSRKGNLVALGEKAQADQKSTPYHIATFRTRSKKDWILVKYLRDAMEACKRKEYELAEEYVTKARSLSPDYYEVLRVNAWLKVEQLDFTEADSLYQEAIEREPKSAPLRVWYGGFLMRHMKNSEDALVQFEEAQKLDPLAYEIQIETIRAKLYLGQFDDVKLLLEKIMQQPTLGFQTRRIAYDLHLQYFQRRAEHLLDVEHNEVSAFSCLENLVEAYDTCPKELRDRQMLGKLNKALPTAYNCQKRLQDVQHKQQSGNLIQKMHNMLY